MFNKNLIKHQTKRSVLIKFLLVAVVFVGYFLWMSQKYGAEQGFYVAFLTWSFFVLCTPIADAGFLIDLPLRLITKIRMLHSEIIVWSIAISLNIYTFFIHPEVYADTKLLHLFQHILEKPFPFWLIIFVSGLGTFVSILFGDELLDKANHHERDLHKKHKIKYRWVVMIFILGLSFVIYDYFLVKLGLSF
jgi:hypothetical protein